MASWEPATNESWTLKAMFYFIESTCQLFIRNVPRSEKKSSLYPVLDKEIYPE